MHIGIAPGSPSRFCHHCYKDFTPRLRWGVVFLLIFVWAPLVGVLAFAADQLQWGQIPLLRLSWGQAVFALTIVISIFVFPRFGYRLTLPTTTSEDKNVSRGRNSKVVLGMEKTDSHPSQAIAARTENTSVTENRAKRSRAGTWVTLVIFISAGYLVFWLPKGDGTVTASSSAGPAASAAEYDKAPAMSYRAALLKEIPDGTLVSFEGHLTHVGSSYALISISNDLVWLNFGQKPRFVEGDVAYIRGRYQGTTKYETVMRSAKEVPLVVVDYYTLIKPRS